MKRLVLLASAMILFAVPEAVSARDYGQQGAVFPVIETDLLSVIQNKLTRMQASGALDRANRELAARTEARVKRPPAVKGIVAASQSRSWIHDPTIIVEQDLRDAKGRVVVARGTRVNPLDTVSLRQRLVFLDGDDPVQVAWATGKTTSLNAKLILVRGSPFALMKAEQRRFYFDQSGTLTTKFGVRAVPAVIEQAGRVLRVSEIVIPKAKGGGK